MQWKRVKKIILLFPFPLSWCKSCDIVIKIEGKNINYIPIILTLGKGTYFNLK